MTAENIEEVELKPSEFKFIPKLRRIVAIVTDRVRAMVKFEWCVDCKHQLCYAHAIHQAVCDILYKKQTCYENDVTEVESGA